LPSPWRAKPAPPLAEASHTWIRPHQHWGVAEDSFQSSEATRWGGPPTWAACVPSRWARAITFRSRVGSAASRSNTAMKNPLWERLPTELQSRVDGPLADDRKLEAIKAIHDMLNEPWPGLCKCQELLIERCAELGEPWVRPSPPLNLDADRKNRRLAPSSRRHQIARSRGSPANSRPTCASSPSAPARASAAPFAPSSPPSGGENAPNYFRHAGYDSI
jgi:hypothetical protein